MHPVSIGLSKADENRKNAAPGVSSASPRRNKLSAHIAVAGSSPASSPGAIQPALLKAVAASPRSKQAEDFSLGHSSSGQHDSCDKTVESTSSNNTNSRRKALEKANAKKRLHPVSIGLSKADENRKNAAPGVSSASPRRNKLSAHIAVAGSSPASSPGAIQPALLKAVAASPRSKQAEDFSLGHSSSGQHDSCDKTVESTSSNNTNSRRKALEKANAKKRLHPVSIGLSKADEYKKNAAPQGNSANPHRNRLSTHRALTDNPPPSSPKPIQDGGVQAAIDAWYYKTATIKDSNKPQIDSVVKSPENMSTVATATTSEPVESVTVEQHNVENTNAYLKHLEQKRTGAASAIVMPKTATDPSSISKTSSLATNVVSAAAATRAWQEQVLKRDNCELNKNSLEDQSDASGVLQEQALKSDDDEVDQNALDDQTYDASTLTKSSDDSFLCYSGSEGESAFSQKSRKNCAVKHEGSALLHDAVPEDQSVHFNDGNDEELEENHEAPPRVDSPTMYQTDQEGSTLFGGLQVGQTDQEGSTLFGQLQVGQTDQEEGSTLFGQLQVGQTDQEGSTLFGGLQVGQTDQEGSTLFGQLQVGQTDQEEGSTLFGQLQVGQTDQEGSTIFGQLQVGSKSSDESTMNTDEEAGTKTQDEFHPENVNRSAVPDPETMSQGSGTLQWWQKNYARTQDQNMNQLVEKALAEKEPVATYHKSSAVYSDDDESVFSGLDDITKSESTDSQQQQPEEATTKSSAPVPVPAFSRETTTENNVTSKVRKVQAPPPPPRQEHFGEVLDESALMNTVNSDITSSLLAGEGMRDFGRSRKYGLVIKEEKSYDITEENDTDGGDMGGRSKSSLERTKSRGSAKSRESTSKSRESATKKKSKQKTLTNFEEIFFNQATEDHPPIADSVSCQVFSPRAPEENPPIEDNDSCQAVFMKFGNTVLDHLEAICRVPGEWFLSV